MMWTLSSNIGGSICKCGDINNQAFCSIGIYCHSHVYIHIYNIYIFIHTCVYIYICTYCIHTYIHIYIYIK